MTRVRVNLPVTDDVEISFGRDVDRFAVQVGERIVELIGGNLIVRDVNRPSNDMPLLKVPA